LPVSKKKKGQDPESYAFFRPLYPALARQVITVFYAVTFLSTARKRVTQVGACFKYDTQKLMENEETTFWTAVSVIKENVQGSKVRIRTSESRVQSSLEMTSRSGVWRQLVR
jgi:hypothetical protein